MQCNAVYCSHLYHLYQLNPEYIAVEPRLFSSYLPGILPRMAEEDLAAQVGAVALPRLWPLPLAPATTSHTSTSHPPPHLDQPHLPPGGAPLPPAPEGLPAGGLPGGAGGRGGRHPPAPGRRRGQCRVSGQRVQCSAPPCPQSLGAQYSLVGRALRDSLALKLGHDKEG